MKRTCIKIIDTQRYDYSKFPLKKAKSNAFAGVVKINKHMKKIILLLAVFTIVFSSCSINKVVYNKDTEQKILLGEINRKGLQKKQFQEWYYNEYDNYFPDEKVVTELKKYMPENAKIVIVLATWCPDSRREVPRFYRILDEIGFNEDNLTVYAVDRNLEEPKGFVEKYEIERVPTMIYWHYDYEAGRIIETPRITLEKHLLKFTQKK
ncbi:MAG: thioredoxin family protein [Bacteroidota bacterium]|nr:thioredoxin family protein [Bacteroidota bacterium]